MPELCAVCPSCAAKLKVSNPALAGKRVQCSRCGAPVLLPGLDEGDGQRAVVAGTPATDILKEQSGPRQEQGQRPRPRPPAPAEEERARPRRQRQRRRKGSSSGARLAAYLIGGVVLVMLAGVAAFLLYRMFSGSPAATAPATSHHIGPVARVAPAEAPLPTAPATTPAPASAPTRQASPPPSAAVEAASFGLTSDAHFYTVDTGAGLVFKVRRTRRSKTL
ncbi:MAG: hypothetical protein JO112_22315, partial [Planctomycetes bacterium]|nr:hypothetical protein [Planctomycetota bacterium]